MNVASRRRLFDVAIPRTMASIDAFAAGQDIHNATAARIFHVAHGTVFIIAGYTFFGLHRLLGFDVFLSAAAGVASAALAGLAIDKIVYGPILRRGGGMSS